MTTEPTALVIVQTISLDSLLVRLIAVALSLAALVAIGLHRRHRPDREIVDFSSPDGEGTEPIEADVAAAEQSIRVETNEAVHRSKQKVKKSLLRLVLVLGTAVPFFFGMPLHAYFRPVGQILLFFSVVASFGVFIDGWGLWIAWSFKREMKKLLEL